MWVKQVMTFLWHRLKFSLMVFIKLNQRNLYIIHLYSSDKDTVLMISLGYYCNSVGASEFKSVFVIGS